MGKSIHFFGHSVFGQLTSLIDRNLIDHSIKLSGSDRFCKGFHTKDHLISMLFCCLSQSNSLREVVAGCLGLMGKAEQIGLSHLPKRSTLSDANAKRTPKVFELIYHKLLCQHRQFISDSRVKLQTDNPLFIIDSTSISLFKEILKSVGRKPISGQSKGGIKAHVLMDAQLGVPDLVWYTSAAATDVGILDKIPYKKGAIYVFDKGYNDYNRWLGIESAGSYFVTRLKENATYTTVEELEIADDIHSGVLKDELIALPIRKNGKPVESVKFRRIAFWDDEQKRVFSFVTNLKDFRADQIANLYKQRWQIETLFKSLKQNFPLKYFLGDNENAIIIQIWCALIANLLLVVLGNKIKRPWAFSNLVSFVRVHLFNLINIVSFLNEPEKDWQKDFFSQLSLFQT